MPLPPGWRLVPLRLVVGFGFLAHGWDKPSSSHHAERDGHHQQGRHIADEVTRLRRPSARSPP